MNMGQKTMLKYFKDPFDEDDAAEIINSDEPVKSLQEITIVWSLREAGVLLDQYFGDKDCSKAMAIILKSGEMPMEEEEEDLL